MKNNAEKAEALVNAIETAESESYGSGDSSLDGDLSADRAAAINAYFGINTNPAPEGNSQVVSRDLFDTVEWITPSLVRIFAGSDEVVKFNPVGPEDDAAAKQESLYINHVVTKRNRWSQIFHDWCKDALLTKNAYCMAYWDDSAQVEYESYANQSDDSFALLMQEDGIEVVEHSQEVDEDQAQINHQQFEQAAQQWSMMAQQAMAQFEQAAQQAAMQGMPPPQPPQLPPEPQPLPEPMLHSVKIRRRAVQGKPSLKVLPPERCVVHQATSNYTLDDCDFFEFWENTSISSLRAMGFDVEDDITDAGSSDTVEDEARDIYGEERTSDRGWEPSMRKVRVRMCWIRHDYDGDGIAELQYCVIVGRTVLYREECNRIPVASIVATPVPHRHIGISIADVMLEIQDTKQSMLRQGIDNLFHANNPRLFVADGKVNIDDALVSRPGGVVRSVAGTDAAFGRDIAPIVIPNIFPQAVQGMEYMDRLSERRTGVNGIFSGNVSQEVLTNSTASAMTQMGTAAAQKVEQIARMISPSVEYLFSCVHELILKHGHKKEVVRLDGNWVTVDPSQWRKRTDLTIAVGLGSGNKDAVLGHLNQMFQMQMALIGMGVTEPKLIYNTVAEISKMAGFGSPDLFWKLPGPPPPPQDPPELQREKARLQFEDKKLQVTQTAEQQKFQAEAQQGNQKLAFEASEAEKDRAMELEKARMAEATKLAIAEMQANVQRETLEQSQDFEAKKMAVTFNREDRDAEIPEREELQSREGQMAELMQNLQTALHALVDATNRPRVAVRDPKTGKPMYGRPMTDEEMQATRQ